MGENERGVPRHTVRETLLGHTSIGFKQQMLKTFTKDNHSTLMGGLAQVDQEH